MGSRRIAKTRSLSSYLSSVNQASSTALIKTNAANTLATNSITSDALAEDLQLFDKNIQSANYVEGYSGWKIAGTGDAEFGNVVVRGDINASSGTIGYWNISNPAVTRVIGSTTLLGTFVESSNPGPNDLEVTAGSYVGLFKSYNPEEVPVTNKERTSNVATLTVTGHQFEVGDSLYITLEDDTTFNNGGLVVVVTSTTPDTFSYANSGTNVSSSETSGYAQLYNPDVAGLYLRDYSKTEFDYGFFSNKGIKYVSAEKVNLVHNPSFEYSQYYIDNGNYGTLSSSSAGWVSSSITTGTVTYTDIYGLDNATDNKMLEANSIYGASVLWTTTAPGSGEYLVGTANYAVASEYGLFTDDKTLTFNFDIFFEHTRSPIGGEILYVESGLMSNDVISKSITTNVATVGTFNPHGYLPGQSVDVTGVDTTINVTNKARTTTTVTLTFASTTHKIVAGDSITVAISDARFDGTFTVATVSATQITYAFAGVTVTTVAASGTITHNLFDGTYTITAVTNGIVSKDIAVTNKVANATTSTLTVASGHGVLATETIDVNIGDGRFDGMRVVTSVTATTILFASESVVVTSAAVSGGTLRSYKTPGTYTFSYAKTHANYTATDTSLYTTTPTAVSGLSDTQTTIRTSTAHGLSVGDTVYFHAYHSQNHYFNNGTYPLGYTVESPDIEEGHSFVVTAVYSTDWFSYDAVQPQTTAASSIPYAFNNTWEITGVDTTLAGDYEVTIGPNLTGYGHHPFQVGDQVFISINNTASSPEWSTYQTITAVTPSTVQFSSTSTDIASGTLYTGTISFKNANIYKYVSPSYDLSNIKIQFGIGGSTADLYDVLTAVSAASSWGDGTRSLSGDFYLGITTGILGSYYDRILPLQQGFAGAGVLEISSKKLYDNYATLNPTGLAADENIYIQFPVALDALDISGIPTGSKIVDSSSTGIYLDNVQLSNTSEFFFGSSDPDAYYWYGGSSAVSGPNEPSVKGTKTWIDVDLDSQTSIIRADAVLLDENIYSKQTFAPAFLGQYFSLAFGQYDSLFGPNPTNYYPTSTLLSSAEVEYSKSRFEYGYLRGSVGLYSDEGHAGVELIAREKVVDDDPYLPTTTMPLLSGMTAWVDATPGAVSRGVVRIYADEIQLLRPTSQDPNVLPDETPVDPPMELNYYSASFTDSTRTLASYEMLGPGSQEDAVAGFIPHAATIDVQVDVTSALTTFNYRTTGSGATTALTANSCFLVFRTGPSGKTHVTIGARITTNSATGSAGCSFGVFPYTRSDGSGYPYIGAAAVFSPTVELYTQISGNLYTMSSVSTIFVGSPNTTYVIAIADRSGSTAYTATFASRHITVVPIP